MGRILTKGEGPRGWDGGIVGGAGGSVGLVWSVEKAVGWCWRVGEGRDLER